MVFFLALALRFLGCGKKTNIDFVLLERFDEYNNFSIIITVLLLLSLF